MVTTQHREQNHGKSGKAKDEHTWISEQTCTGREGRRDKVAMAIVGFTCNSDHLN
jgi:hypothetical protein